MIFRFSGRIQAEHLSALQKECEHLDTILVFDLREIQLVDEAAVRHGAGVETETSSPKDAYAKYGPLEDGPASDLL